MNEEDYVTELTQIEQENPGLYFNKCTCSFCMGPNPEKELAALRWFIDGKA